MTFPPLTTIRQPKYSVGRTAFEIVQQLIASGSAEPIHRVVDVELVERASVAKLTK
jgi:LacI family transcriptional regulator